MSSSDGQAGPVPRTTGLRPARSERADDGGSDGATDPGEVERLRERIAELEADLEQKEETLEARETRIEELTDELETARRERDDARQWATFLDREIREHRDRVRGLEERVEELESGGLLGRLRRRLS